MFIYRSYARDITSITTPAIVKALCGQKIKIEATTNKILLGQLRLLRKKPCAPMAREKTPIAAMIETYMMLMGLPWKSNAGL